MPAVAEGLYGEPLLGQATDGRVIGRLADKWQWLENGTILQLTLPKGARFHDGSELTAQVVAGVLERRFANARAPAESRNVAKIETPASDTLKIHLREPDAFLPDSLGDIPILRDGAVGTGPFMVDGPPPTQKGAALRAFSGYRQGRPEVTRIEVKPYPTLRAAWTAMMRGDINMLHEVSSEAAQFAELESRFRLYSFVRPYTYFVAFNVRHRVLGRRDVRQALSQAVDRGAIVRDAMRGRGEVADGPIWKYHWAYSTAQRAYQYNPDAARLRLDAGGLPVRQEGPGMPARFRFTCLMFGNDPRFERVALLLQKQLYDIGVDMAIEALPLNQLADRMRTGDFDAFLMEVISGRSLLWPYRVWRSKPNPSLGEVSSGYTAADGAFDRLRHAVTESQVRSVVSELQQVLYEDPPALFLAWPHASRAVHVDVEVPDTKNTDIISRVWRFRRAVEAPQQ